MLSLWFVIFEGTAIATGYFTALTWCATGEHWREWVAPDRETGRKIAI
jgi:hypothetical protein